MEQRASWIAEGRIEVHRLGEGGSFRYELDIDLRHTAIDVTCFPRLARQHGLMIAWCVDEEAPDDWRYHVAHPRRDGGSEMARLAEHGGWQRLFPPAIALMLEEDGRS